MKIFFTDRIPVLTLVPFRPGFYGNRYPGDDDFAAALIASLNGKVRADVDFVHGGCVFFSLIY